MFPLSPLIVILCKYIKYISIYQKSTKKNSDYQLQLEVIVTIAIILVLLSTIDNLVPSATHVPFSFSLSNRLFQVPPVDCDQPTPDTQRYY